MKLLKIPNGSLSKIKLSTVQNAETMGFIAKIMKELNIQDLSQIGNKILEAPSINYAITNATQSGYEITNAKVIMNEDYTDIVTAREVKDAYRVEEMNDALLEKFGLTWDSKMYIHFDIYFELKPIK